VPSRLNTSSNQKFGPAHPCWLTPRFQAVNLWLPEAYRCDNRFVRKADITGALVSRLVGTQFSQWAGLPVRPVDAAGWDNVTFRLGEEMSVRLPSAEEYVPGVHKEQRWLPVLAGQLPLPIPELVAVGEPGCGFPWSWSVYRWIDGAPVTDHLANT
jgi:aminoglycoside phosphotransferase (APT) family kinase protein